MISMIRRFYWTKIMGYNDASLMRPMPLEYVHCDDGKTHLYSYDGDGNGFGGAYDPKSKKFVDPKVLFWKSYPGGDALVNQMKSYGRLVDKHGVGEARKIWRESNGLEKVC